MKHLEEQIKFIDTKLLPIYGFKNIIDYTYIICISNMENLKLDLDKLNGLIEEFRKVFHSKNFSLHKTQYKILTKSQAVCLLKTCLEITSIPHDVSLKKNQKYLRLISKNNILEKYINTLKMTENGILNIKSSKKTELKLGEFKELDTKSNEQSDTDSNTTYDKINNNCYKIRTKSQDPKMIVKPFILEGLKKYEERKIITKKQLNDGIKKTNSYEFFLTPKRLVINEDFNKSMIEIDMKNYNLNDKILKSFCVKFISKKINDQLIFTETLIEHLIKNIQFKIKIGDRNSHIWAGKFINGSNCIIDNVILPNKYIQFHNVMLCLTNIEDILYLLENLEIKISCECVNLYNEIDDIIQKSQIEQLICMENDKYNILKIVSGMAGIAYNEYLNLDKLNKLQNGSIIKNEELQKNQIEVNKNDIINESKLFIGNPIFFNDIEGFEITNHSKDFVNQNASKALNYKYDFVCWDKLYEINAKDIEYCRTSNKNIFTHCYKINIGNTDNTDEQIQYTMSKLKIITNFNLDKISNMSINYCGTNKKKLDLPIKYNINNYMLELDLENKHVLLYTKISHIQIQIESENEEELLREKITVAMKAFEWSTKYSWLFTDIKMFVIDPNTISLEYNRYINGK